MDNLGNVSDHWFQEIHQFSIAPDPPQFNTAIDTYLWPTSDRYKTPIAATYASYLPNLQAFNSQPEWIIRDGLVPLLWFFNRYPDPKGLSSKLLIHSTLVNFVPKAWRPYVGAYRLFSDQVSHQPIKRILLTGVLSEAYVSLNGLDRRVEQVKQGEADGIWDEKAKVIGFLPAKDFVRGGRYDIMPMAVHILSRLTNALGRSIHSISLHELYSYFDMTDVLVIDIGCGILNADNGVEHMCLRKGASSLSVVELQKKRENEKVVYLSKGHGFLIESNPTFLSGETWDREKMQMIAEVSQEPAFTDLPWPTIYIDWAKQMFEQSLDGQHE